MGMMASGAVLFNHLASVVGSTQISPLQSDVLEALRQCSGQFMHANALACRVFGAREDVDWPSEAFRITVWRLRRRVPEVAIESTPAQGYRLATALVTAVASHCDYRPAP